MLNTLPPFPMRPAFPVSEYYDGSAPCAPFSGPRAYPDATSLAGPPAPGPRHTRFPRSLCFDQQAWRPALLLRPRHGYAVDIHRDLPGQTRQTLPGVPSPAETNEVRTAHQPISTGFELANCQEALQHRFLAYTLPSRSPSPTHPAVLDRLDFVAAAPTLPGVPRIRLPPASPTCHDRPAAESSHPHSKQHHLVAHHKPADTSG